MTFAVLLGSLAASAVAAQLPAPPPIDPAEIVVTGRPGSARPQPDVVEHLRTFCFDPARRSGRMAPPAENSRWYPLDDEARRQFRIEDPDVPAFSRADGVRGHELWLKLEEFREGKGLVEQRCTILAIGGRDHRRFVDDMSRLFGGPPTQRHVGEPDGLPAIPGWEQWLWTGMPNRRSSNWRSLERTRGAAPSWLVVIDPDFYRDHVYIVGDMKLRQGAGRPVTLLKFSVFKRRS
jgi:hypothetical protein